MKRQQYTKRSNAIKSEDQSFDLRRGVRRPDRAIYQPGVSSLGRGRTDDDIESRPASGRSHSTSTSSNVCPTSSTEHGCDEDATQSVRQKRPDAQLYVPKHRQPTSDDDDACGKVASKATVSPHIDSKTSGESQPTAGASIVSGSRGEDFSNSGGSSPERTPKSDAHTTDGRDSVRRQMRIKQKPAGEQQIPAVDCNEGLFEGESWVDILDREEEEHAAEEKSAAKSKVVDDTDMVCERFDGLVIRNSGRNLGASPIVRDGRPSHSGDRKQAASNGDSHHNRGHISADVGDNAHQHDSNLQNVSTGKGRNRKPNNQPGIDTGRRHASCGRGHNRYQERRHGLAVNEGKIKSTDVKSSSTPIACGRGKRRQADEERRHSEHSTDKHGAYPDKGRPRAQPAMPATNVTSQRMPQQNFGRSSSHSSPPKHREGQRIPAYQPSVSLNCQTDIPAMREHPVPVSHMGGIIRLPPPAAMAHHMDQRYPLHMPLHPRSGGGRGGCQRSLYDPNNPSQPIHITGDPSHQYDLSVSPESRGYFMEGMMAEAQQCQYYTGYVPPPPQQPPQYGTSPPYGSYANGAQFANVVYMREQYPYIVPSEADLHSSERTAGSVGAIVTEVMGLERELNELLSRRIHGKAGFDKVLALRRAIYQKCGELVLAEPDVSCKHNMEQVLWRAAFYQVIEVFRRQLTSSHEDADEGAEAMIRDQLLRLIDEGTDFYERLLTNLQTAHYFNISDILNSEAPAPPPMRRRAKLALLSCQRCLICLGDLARYHQLTCHTANYGKARSWYMKAQGIAPKNGRPHNQLAILALYTKRRIDAVYYYMRSLAASNPFITARESLMSLFDEARKKAEVIQKQKQLELAAKLKQRPTRQRQTSGHRTETWILPDGRSCHDDIDDDDDDSARDDLSKLSPTDLNKRFSLSFLNVHGILFTRIGMESLAEYCADMLREYEALLQVSPCPIGNMRLIQLFAINMFAIDNTAAKAGTPMEENCRPLVQDQTIRLSLDMFTILIQRCTAMIRQRRGSVVPDGDSGVNDDGLQQLLPGIKIWTDWMLCHDHLWNPTPQSANQLPGGMNMDVWQTVAELSNLLKTIDISDVKFYSQRNLGCDLLVLEEDQMLAGFVPLLSLPQVPVFVESSILKDKACACLRVQLLRLFADYLCGIEPPVLSYSIESRAYKPCTPDIIPADTGQTPHSKESETYSDSDNPGSLHSDEDVHIDDTTTIAATTDSDIEHLRARKHLLQQRVAQESRRKQIPDLEQGRRLELVVRPRILVPDTNCFIDHLDAVRRLLDAALYVIVVPLVVINELDGLARGGAFPLHRDVEHRQRVKTAAGDAVTFLETQCDARNAHLRAVTCKGSVLETIAFRSEELHDDGTNDDKILSCCLHYCQDKARDYMPKDKDEPIRLHREVVLLTDDRNLRLKAHTRNVPVKDMPEFMKTFKIL